MTIYNPSTTGTDATAENTANNSATNATTATVTTAVHRPRMQPKKPREKFVGRFPNVQRIPRQAPIYEDYGGATALCQQAL